MLSIKKQSIFPETLIHLKGDHFGGKVLARKVGFKIMIYGFNYSDASS